MRANIFLDRNNSMRKTNKAENITTNLRGDGRKQRGTKQPFDESETEERKAGLKLNIQKNEDYGIQSYHLMANRWGNNGNSERL